MEMSLYAKSKSSNSAGSVAASFNAFSSDTYAPSPAASGFLDAEEQRGPNPGSQRRGGYGAKALLATEK